MAAFPKLFGGRREQSGGEPHREERGRDYGPWGELIRELAGWDVDRYDVVARWPLAEALIAYERLLGQQALPQFRHEQSLYAAGSLKTSPKLPSILSTPAD